MILSDSHCHLTGYRPALLTAALKQARDKGVAIFLSVGMTVESSVENIRLAKAHQGVYAAIGIHPWNAVPLDDEVRRHLARLASQEGVVAFGEIGLDYARHPETKEMQKELLRYELSLAMENRLPVNLHCREAHQEMMAILRQETGPSLKGIIHGFTGDRAALEDWLELGFYVSIGVRGLVSNEIPALAAVARDIPLDRLLTETDATGAGQSPGPADVLSVAQKLASIRGTTAEEVAEAATENLKRLLKI